jgi:predicted nucleic acid-binding protein
VIILDTNVLSALMRKLPDAAVVGRLDRQPAESIWIVHDPDLQKHGLYNCPR